MKATAKNVFIFSLLLYGAAAYAQDTTKAWQDVDWHNFRKQPRAQQATRVKRTKPEFHYPVKQVFFQGENVYAYEELGARFTAGYRFGQWAIVGAGVGVDLAASGFSARSTTDPYGGVYFPLYVHYSGDILKKRVTPFYTAEAGYAFRTAGDESYITVTGLNHPIYKFAGGFTGAADLGVKFYPGRRVFVSLAAGLDIMQGYDKYSNYSYNSIGKYISLSYSSYNFFFMPGLKVAVGF